MDIGCHGMRHRPWRGLKDRELHEELVQARTILERTVGRPVTRAACPFGSYDRRTLRTLRDCGYEHVYTSDRGTARLGDFLQARNSGINQRGEQVFSFLATAFVPRRKVG